jgi:putative restriction endonuclease
MYSAEVQAAIREDVFSWLDKRRASGIEELARAELLDYRFGERPIPLVDRNRGIRNPAEFDATLSILTSPTGPYDDLAGADGLVHYAYREGDPYTGDNR